MREAPALPPGRGRRVGATLRRVLLHAALALTLYLFANVVADVIGVLDAIAPDAAGRPIVTALFLLVGGVCVLMVAVLIPVYAVVFALLATSVVLLHVLRLGDRGLFVSLLALLFLLQALGYLLAYNSNLP